MLLDYVALGVIILLMIGATAAIVVAGSLPGRIATKRNHPWPAAVNVASWIGLATGVLWPLALIWAFLPVPNPRNEAVVADGPRSTDDLATLRQQIAELTSTVAQLKSNSKEVDP